MEYQHYELRILDEEDEIYAIALVNDPAIESNFVAFNKQKEIKFSTVSNEKRIILGPVMVPDFEIFRKNESDGYEYTVSADADTIEQLSQQFMQRYHQKDVTLEHEFGVEGTTVVESWIKTSENDKSTDHGYGDKPIGTWFVAMKVDSDVIWENVKNGTFKGFSIEGFLSSVPVEMQKIDKDIDDLTEDELDDLYEEIKALHNKK